MGQQRAASGTWRSHNKPTSRDSYETMGQQTCPSNMSHPAIEPDRVKKSKSRFEAERKIPSESEGKSSDFARYGMVVILIMRSPPHEYGKTFCQLKYAQLAYREKDAPADSSEHRWQRQ